MSCISWRQQAIRRWKPQALIQGEDARECTGGEQALGAGVILASNELRGFNQCPILSELRVVWKIDNGGSGDSSIIFLIVTIYMS